MSVFTIFIPLFLNSDPIYTQTFFTLPNIELPEITVQLPTFRETQELLHEEVIPFVQELIEDPTLPLGETRLVQQGKEGLFKVIGFYQINEETREKNLIEEVEDLIQPTPEVVAYGTYNPYPETAPPATTQTVTGTTGPKLVEGRDFGYETTYFPGPVQGVKDQLYRISTDGHPDYSHFDSSIINNRLYIAESITRTGKLFSELKVGEIIILEGQEYQVKAIEFPTTAQRDVTIPDFPNRTGVAGWGSTHTTTSYGNSNTLEEHIDYLLSTYYYSPTVRAIQVCVDSRMVPSGEWGTNGSRFTNKIIILDHPTSPIPSGVGLVYPFIGWDYVSPVYSDISYW